MKEKLFILIILICLISTSCKTTNTNGDLELESIYPVDLPKKPLSNVTYEDAFAAVKNMKAGVNLGNNFDCGSYDENQTEPGWIIKWGDGTPCAWETAWGQPEITKEVIHSIKLQGFCAIRLPVTWIEHLDEENNISPEWMARVKEVVTWILEEDLYCLVNTHHDSGWVKCDEKHFEKYKDRYAKLYKQIGEEFNEFGEKLILCGTNEMVNDVCQGNANHEALVTAAKWNQLFVNTIRSTGGNNAGRNLVIGAYCCAGNDLNLRNLGKPEDNIDRHLILEVHNYAPMDFTWSKESWLPNWKTEWKPYMESNLLQDIALMKKYSDKYDMPVIIGEWGTLSRRFPGKDDNGKLKYKATTDEEGAKFTEFFTKETYGKYGFCSFYWDTAELIDRKTGEVKSPLMIKGIMKGCEQL